MKLRRPLRTMSAFAAVLSVAGLALLLSAPPGITVVGSPSQEDLRQFHRLVRCDRWARTRTAMAQHDYEWLRVVLRESLLSRTTLHGMRYNLPGRPYGLVVADGMFDTMEYAYMIEGRSNRWTLTDVSYVYVRPVR